MNRPRRRPPHRRPLAEPLENRAYLTPLVFAKPQQYAAGSNPADLAVADMNGDGIPDVVVADDGNAPNTPTPGTPGTGGVSVVLGTGTDTATTGAFNAPQFYTVNTPFQSVAVGDLNDDGYPDVVTVGVGEPYVYVWMNNGNGTLAAPVAYAVGSRPEAVALADVNNDGHLDIITANQGQDLSGSISVLIGNFDPTTGKANGTFKAAVSYDGGPNPDALAVGDLNGDGYPDIVTVDPENNEVHVLLNRGTAVAANGTPEAGTFPATPTTYLTDTTGRAVTIGDVNNDARPDIIVANLRSADVGVLINNGQGLFQGQVTYKTGAFPFSVVSADINGDNRPDLITADSRDNAVGILVHNGSGAFDNGGTDATPYQFSAGTTPQVAPEAVGVADVNGDGRPDLITANFNDNSIGVILNETYFPPLITTTLTITPSLNPVQSKNALTLTATITPAPSSAFTAGRVVQFLDGDKVLGLGKLTPAGTATITTAVLPVGMTSVVARYNGNAHYSPSVAAVNEAVVSSGVATPLVAATAVRLTGALGTATAPFVPGDRATAAVTITNHGAGKAKGAVTVALSIAPAGDLAAAVPLTTVGNATFNLGLVGGRGTTVRVAFTLPADVIAGGYTVLASLVPATLTAEQVSAVPVATTTPTMVALEFGRVPSGRHAPTLTTTLPSGAVVTLSLTGPGIGSLAETSTMTANGVVDTVDLIARYTTAATAISMTVDSGGPVAINGFTDNYRLGSLMAPDVTVTGSPAAVSIGLATGVNAITLAGITDGDINIGPDGHAALSLGTVTDTALSSVAALQSLSVTSWSNTSGDAIITPGIRGALTSTGDFGPRMVLSGAAMPVALGSASIGGNLDSSAWSVGTTVGNINVGGDVTGVFVAKSFGDLSIGGSLIDAEILAGTTFGKDGVFGGGDDTFNAGRIASVVVGGNVTGSLVAAGFKPASDDPFTPVGGTLLPGGKIGSITVDGTIDAASRFAAASLPTMGGNAE